jgi:hypothetical protein
LRKGRYRCKRYLLYLPVAIGDRLDLSVDYLVRLFGPAIVLVPKDAEFSLSRLENSRISGRQNHASQGGSSTSPLVKDSKMDDRRKST